MKYICLLILFSLHSKCQPWLFYNVENLFDTILDQGFQDEEFTPLGAKKYNSIKYRLCIRQSARALYALSKSNYESPIIALCEIENRTVIEDLIQHKAIRKLGPWGIVHYDSPDHRGIDCAVIYKTKEVKIMDSERIRYSTDSLLTRDALFIRYQVDSNFYNLVVVHLPSKRGGAASSKWKREYAWNFISSAIDTCSGRTIVMGDFNDLVKNELLEYFSDPWAIAMPTNSQGSYKYQGRCSVIDGALANFNVCSEVCDIPLIQEIDSKWGQLKPKRRWLGSFFQYGYSDHLPVYFSTALCNGK